MNDTITRKYDIEVCTSPQYVEVFITYISPELKRMGSNKEEFIVCIPSMTLAFSLPVSMNLFQIQAKLKELNTSIGTWMEPLAAGIYFNIEALCKELNIKKLRNWQVGPTGPGKTAQYLGKLLK